MKKLTKGIEDSKKEKERLVEEKEKLRSVFKEIEQKAFIVQENYKKTQEVFYFHLLFLLEIIVKQNFLLLLNDFLFSSGTAD